MPTFPRASFPVIVRPDGTRQNLSLGCCNSSTHRASKFDEKTAQGMSVRAEHISLSIRELVSSPMGSAAPRWFTAASLVRSSLPIEAVRQCSVEVGQGRNVAMDAPSEGQRKAKNNLVQLLASSSYPIPENILRPLCFLKISRRTIAKIQRRQRGKFKENSDLCSDEGGSSSAAGSRTPAPQPFIATILGRLT
ncbi:uncharacterized protein [Aegilops tauschii subsp. strangulata]|uniref:uncharacterized protein n=1 Tax=Aegilops tauschii subsp. strangulata TaxID=200361 RepID=UPI00098B0D8B|nr:uncharacterized protein LOC109748964 [Aegilops tauschii subsp. strangulata]XP_040252488.1 uncharacterized protein LOC109748964 [Aegilops tauschii subsp. strangulata]